MIENAKSFSRFIQELYFLTQGYHAHFVVMVLLFLANAVVEVVGLGMIAAYAGLLISPTESTEIQLLPQWVRSFMVELPYGDQLVLIGQFLVALFLIKALLLVVINALVTQIVGDMGTQVKLKAVRAYVDLPYLKYTSRPGSHYLVASETYSVQAAGSVKSLLKLISEGILAVGIFYLLARTNLVAVLSLAALVIVSLLAYDKIFRKRMFSYGREINENRKCAVQALQEGLLGLKEVRMLGKQEYFTRKVESSMNRVVRSQVRHRIVSVLPEAGLQFLLIVAIVISVSLAIESKVDLIGILPVIGLFALAGLRLVPVGVNTGVAVSQLRGARHAVGELFSDLIQHANSSEEIDRTSGHVETWETDFQVLRLSNICFSHKGRSDPVLHELNLEVKRGEAIGIMGVSGSGKTTLLDVILGLIAPDVGLVEVNGVNIQQARKWWTGSVAYIPQEVFLLNGTITENIALGVSPSLIDEQRVNAVVAASELMTVLDDRSGLDTLVGERGLQLSGGQRQRVAIARALYFQRQVIIMDEATSALDHETEQTIAEAVRQALPEHTFLIVAHRRETLRKCDHVFELRDGSLSKIQLPD